MTFLTLDQAKAHLNVTVSLDDADITLKLEAAEQAAVEYLNRDVYANQADLNAAIAAAPVALTAATTAYEAAIAAADLVENEVERCMARFAANEAYTAARSAARKTHQGIVINSNIKAAVLLKLGSLYAEREDESSSGANPALSSRSRALLFPYRASMGV